VPQRVPGTADSLIFGKISVSPETGDASGLEFSFEVFGDSLRGAYRGAAGEVSRPGALQGLRYDQATDSVAFWYTTGGRNIYYVRGRITCSAFDGTIRHRVIPDYRDSIDSEGSPVPVTLPRVLRPYRAP